MTRWTWFVDAVNATDDVTCLALFRIAMGLCVWLTVGTVVAQGLVPVIWFDVADGGMQPLGRGGWLVSMLGGPTPTLVWGLVSASLVAGAAMVAGLGGRWSALVALLSSHALVSLSAHAVGSYDLLLTNGLWLAVIADGSQTLSVPAYLRTGQWWPAVQGLAFPRWLIAFQLVLMYFSTGIQKVSAYWTPGGEASALYYIMQQPSWQYIDMTWVAWVYPLTQVGTTVTWFWEVFAPLWLLALWWSTDAQRAKRAGRRTVAEGFDRLQVRWWFFGLGVVVHILIHVTLDVGPFSWLSLAYYAAMVHPHEWRRVASRLGPSSA